MTNKTIELDYNSNLDQKLISKIGNPFKFDNPAMQDIMNKFYNTNEVVVNKKILVIRMYDMAVKYAENNSVIYITDNKEKYDKFLELINNEKYGGNDDAWFIEDYRNLDVEIGDMKFDIIIGNPPYGQHGLGSLDLHYEIAERLFGKYNEKMIFIMPGRVGFSTSEKFDKWKKKFTNVSNMDFVGNPFENVAIAGVYIFTFENHNVDKVTVKGIEYNSLLDITPFTEYENKFMTKLKNENPNYNGYKPIGSNKEWTENGENYFDNYAEKHNFNKNEFYVLLSMANGSKIGQGICISSQDKTHIVNGLNNLKNYCKLSNNATKVFAKFSTIEEAKNYLIAVQRPLCRFGLVKMQDDQNMTERVYKYIPDIDWTDDRTKTDEGILEMVGFSKEESKEFADYTKNYMAKIDEQFNNRPRKKRKSKKDYFADMKD